MTPRATRIFPGGIFARRPCPLWLAALLLYALSILLAPRARAEDDPPAIADLAALERAFQQVAENVAPSVVAIRAERLHVASLPGAPAVEQRALVNGSGTIIDADGLILTNEHVIQSAASIDVLFHDGQKLPAAVVASDPRSDLAVLHVDRDGLEPATFGDWTSVSRGTWTIVVGNPFGLGSDGRLSLSVGVIANLGRQLPGLGEVDDRFYYDMIQLTAPIHPGNSGGPLFNIHGELIGIVTAMHTRAPADEGMGFAIPMTPAKRRAIQILSEGRPVEYGYIGATVRVPQRSERERLKLDRGVVVQRLEPEGPAAQAGMRVGDVILDYSETPVTGPAQLAELAGLTPVETIARLSLLRNGKSMTIPVVVAQRDISRVSWMRGDTTFWRGMRVTDLSEDARRRMRVAGGASGIVVIDVEGGSPAERAGMQVGDVIDQVGEQPIRDTLEFLLRVRGASGTLTVSLHDGAVRAITP